MGCCDDIEELGLPKGDQGDPGTDGTNGADGFDAFTILTAPFSQPPVDTTRIIAVSNAGQYTGIWGATGQTIYIESGGYYTVVSSTATAMTIVYGSEFATANQALTGVGSPVANGGKVSPAGSIGLQGIPGTNGADGTDGTNGTNGTDGTNGTNGSNAYTLVASPGYNQPTTGTPITINVANGLWASVGQIIFIQNGGYYTVNSVGSTTLNISYSTPYASFNHALTAAGSPVATSNKVSPAGLIGTTAGLIRGINSLTSGGYVSPTAIHTSTPSASLSSARMIVTYNATWTSTGSGASTIIFQLKQNASIIKTVSQIVETSTHSCIVSLIFMFDYAAGDVISIVVTPQAGWNASIAYNSDLMWDAVEGQ